MVRKRSHRGALIGVTFVLAALIAPCAQAGTVSVVGSTLTFTAAPGEANHVTINFTGEVMDTGASLTPGAGCGVGGPGWVLCGGTLDTFNVDLGDGDDYVLLFATYGHHATINGGPGADTIQDEQDTATIQGGSGNDDITAFGVSDDVIKGGDGNDSLWGGGVDGSLDGQAGADTIAGNADYSSRTNPVTVTADGVADDGESGEHDNVLEGSTIVGGAGADHLTLGGAASLHGGPGNDVLHGSEQDDWIDGGAGSDVMDGEGGIDLADYRSRTNGVNVTLADGLANDGETGENDQVLDTEGVLGGSGNDMMAGGNGDERFYPGAGNDAVTAGGGTDLLSWSPGADMMIGGPGTDIASFAEASSVTVSLDGLANDGEAGENDNVGTDVENLEGSPGNDVLIGSDIANVFDPSFGDDEVSGLGGDDTLTASAGADFFDGGPGGDTGNDLWDSGNSMNGGEGNDTLASAGPAAGGPGNDVVTGSDLVDGGEGNDDVFGSADDELIGGPGTDSLHGQGGADNLIGGPGKDTLDGANSFDTWADYSDHSADVRVDLGAGKGGAKGEGDTIVGVFNVRGGSGDDVLLGDANHNALMGGPGSDRMDGRGEFDTVTYEGSILPIRADLDGSAGNDGAAGEHDTIGTDVEWLVGGDAGDMLFGNASSRDHLFGGPGNDKLHGLQGNDALSGGEGADKLFGDRGDDGVAGDGGADVLVDDAGRDFFTGGDGNDLIEAFQDDSVDVYNGSDGADTVDFSAFKKKVEIVIGSHIGIDGERVGSDVEIVIGGKAGDRLIGDASDNTLSGGGGSDFLDGKGGADVLSGGPGAHDRVSYSSRTASVSVDLDGSVHDDGEAGEGDTVSADVEDVLAGSGADDLVGNTAANLLRGGLGADSFAGGAGKDVVDYSDHAASVTVDLSDPGTQGAFGEGDTLSSIEGAIGGPMADSLTGNSADNWFQGGLGADAFAGLGGFDTLDYSEHKKRVVVVVDNKANDGVNNEHDYVPTDIERLVGSPADDVFLTWTGHQVLERGRGDDILDAWTGNDVYRGGSGFDYVAYFGRSKGVHADLDGRADNGQSGERDAIAADIEGLAGGNASDVLVGNGRGNGLVGGPGGDRLTGAGGHDGLFGDAGGDTLYARDGTADLVQGGAGADTAFTDAGLDIVQSVEALARSTTDHLPALSVSGLRAERLQLVGAGLHDSHVRLRDLVPRAWKIPERL